MNTRIYISLTNKNGLEEENTTIILKDFRAAIEWLQDKEKEIDPAALETN